MSKIKERDLIFGVSVTVTTEHMDALKPKLFVTLQQEGVLNEDHAGGCILFEKRAQVEGILNNEM